MKPLFTILALFTITLHVTAGSVGSVIICNHLNGDSHALISADSADTGECCDHGFAHRKTECDSCVDTKIDKSDLTKVPSPSERSSLKNPLTQIVELVELEDFVPQNLICVASLKLSRAPPATDSGLAPHIKVTVLRV